MKSLWEQLNERDKWALMIGISCIVLYLFYYVAISPLYQAIEQKTSLLLEKRKTLSWMKTTALAAKGTNTVQSITNNRLITVVSEQLHANSTFRDYPFQLQQTSLGDIELTFARVPYAYFIQWLWNLNQHYSLHIKQMMIEQTEIVGVVKVNLSLTA